MPGNPNRITRLLRLTYLRRQYGTKLPPGSEKMTDKEIERWRKTHGKKDS